MWFLFCSGCGKRPKMKDRRLSYLISETWIQSVVFYRYFTAFIYLLVAVKKVKIRIPFQFGSPNHLPSSPKPQQDREETSTSICKYLHTYHRNHINSLILAGLKAHWSVFDECKYQLPSGGTCSSCIVFF